MDKNFTKWLDNILSKFNKGAVAYCFNIYENERNYSIEFVAANSFNANDNDWAADEIYASRNDNNELIFIADSIELAKKYVEQNIKQYLAVGKYSKLLQNGEAVACGFVDGDLSILYKKSNSIKSSSVKQENEDQILEYLVSGNLFSSNSSDKHFGYDNIFTDGQWFWDDDLISAVKYQHYKISDAFYQHIVNNNWKVPLIISSPIKANEQNTKIEKDVINSLITEISIAVEKSKKDRT
jgi:hypothetical protein